MTKSELEKYYRSFETMFRSKGWKNFKEDILRSANEINQVEACQDDKDLYFRKGQLSMAANVLNLEAMIEQTKEQQAEADEINT